jgi:hypothetical protein
MAHLLSFIRLLSRTDSLAQRSLHYILPTCLAACALLALTVVDPAGAHWISFGETVEAEISSPGEEHDYSFEAGAGEVVLVRMAQIGTGFDPKITLKDPNGEAIAEHASDILAEIVTPVLTSSGVYRLRAADKNQYYTGSYALHLQRLIDPVMATPISLGETITADIAVMSETDAYTFHADGDEVILARIGQAGTGFDPEVRLYDYAGSLVAGHWSEALAEFTWPVSPYPGVYTLLAMEKNGVFTSSYGLHVQTLVEPGMAVPIEWGEALESTVTAMGEADAYTLIAYPGDVFLVGMGQLGTGFDPEVRLYDPDGDLVTSRASDMLAEFTTEELTEGGDYTLLAMDENGIYTSSYGIHVQRLNEPEMTTPIALGETLERTIDVKSETDAFTFDASAGDVILARMGHSGADLAPKIRLYDPDGLQIESHWSHELAEFTSAELTQTGAYAVLASDMNGVYSGSYGIHVQRLNNPGVTTPLPLGEALSRSIGAKSETDAYTFSAAAGDVILVRMGQPSSVFDPEIRLYDPGGLLVASHSSDKLAEIVTTVLRKGKYTALAMDERGIYTTDYGIHVQKPNNPGMATPIAYGETIPDTISVRGETGAFTFDALAGDVVSVRMERSHAGFYPEVRLYDPNGMLVGRATSYPIAEISEQELSLTGTHTILAMDLYGTNTQEYTVSLDYIGAEALMRGDDDGDGDITISDPILSLCAQFADCDLACLDASDTDDDGAITISDPIYNLAAQFADGPPPPAPFPGCGPDPTEDQVTCDCHSGCMGCGATLHESGTEVHVWLGTPERQGLSDLLYPVYVHTSEALLGFECTASFSADLLSFEGITSSGELATAHDFLSAREGNAEQGIVRMGGVVSFDLSRSLEPGMHEVGKLEFRSHEYGELPEPLLISGRFVATDMSAGSAQVGAPAGVQPRTEVKSLSLTATPNPTTGATAVSYALHKDGSVGLVVYSAQGRLVRTLVDRHQIAGRYDVTWDRRTNEGLETASGVYFCRLSTPAGKRMMKIVLSE